MSADSPHIVFDCNVFLQAMISPGGPAAKCLRMVQQGELKLFVSDYVLAEIRDLPNDHKVAAKFGLTVEKAERFITELVEFAEYCNVVAEIYRHPHDSDDSHYINLAIATRANLIVSRNRHLLNLMDSPRIEAQDFQRRFPELRIMEPVGLLRWIDERKDRESSPYSDPK